MMTIRNNESIGEGSLRRRVLRSTPDSLTSCRVSLIRVVPLFFTLMLCGCEEVNHAVVLNRVDMPIVMHWQSDNIFHKIQPDTDVEIAWERGCITVIEGNESYYFDSGKAPEVMIVHGIFRNVVKILYRHGELSYVNNSGERFMMPKMKKNCQSSEHTSKLE